MSKFKKRIQKISKDCQHALVIGSCFGKLEDLLEIYGTVFVISDAPPAIKSKKLIYRDNFDYLITIPNINLIVFDLSTVDRIPTLKDCWLKNKSKIVIEGNEPLGREFTKTFYETNWGCTSLQGDFHVWEQIK